MKFYGTDEETVIVTNKGIFLVQSPDFYLPDQYEVLEEIPEGFNEINPALCFDVLIPKDLR